MKKKRYIILAIIFLVNIFSIIAGDINISSCSNLTESNSIYVLNNSINANNIGTCININADNITLNCNGYSIYNWSDIRYAIKIENRTNIVLKNCNIYNSTFGNYGIDIRNSTNSTIYNITLYTKWAGIKIRDSNGITINYSYINSIQSSIDLSYSQYINIVNNSLFNRLQISSSSYSNVTDNIITYKGRDSVFTDILYIFSSNGLNISNNIINVTNKTNYMSGILLSSVSNSSVSGNIIRDCFLDVKNYGTHKNVIFSNNLFEDNVHTSMVSYEFGLPNSYSDLVSINYPNGSTANNLNSYQIEIKPSEDISSITFSNGKLTNFYPTRRGFYYIKLNVTDDYNNTFKNLEYIYFVSPSYDTKTIKFYIRPDLLPTHGQPYGNDAKAMVLSPPTSESNFTCGSWVQASPDEFGFIYPSIISGIHANVLYKSNVFGFFGIERYVTYSPWYDYSNPVNDSSEFIFLDSEFNNLSWVLEKPDEWYALSVKLKGTWPVVKTNTTDISYVNFTINYTNTPYIKSISDNETEIMSATMPYYLGSALIIMNGSGTINMTVEMPYTANSYNAYFDGVDCDSNPNCSFTYYGKELNFTLVLGSEHTLEINSGGELYTVCDSGCNFVELNECLYAINNSNSTCIILQDSTKTYYINNSYYLSSYNGSSIIVNSTAPITIDCQFNTLYSIYKNNTLFNITNVNDVAIRNCIIRYSSMYEYAPFKVSFYIDNSTNISLYNINVNNGVYCTYDHILAYDSSNINLVNFSSSAGTTYEGMVRLYNVSNLNANMLNTGCGLIASGNVCTINSLGGTIRYINFMCNNSVISNSQLSHLDAQLHIDSATINYDNAIAIEANNVTLNNISIALPNYGDRYVNVSLINLTGNNIYFKNNYISKLWASYKAPIRTIFANGDNITILNNTFNNLGSKSNGIYFKDSNNVTISKNTFYIINKSVEVYDSSLISITNNTFNITNDTYIYNSNNVSITNNKYYNCGGKHNAYFVGFTPVEYNSKAYDDVVAVNIGLTNIFNTATCGVNYVDQIDGTTDYDLFLLEDPSNLAGFGAGANITIFIESGSGLSCALFSSYGYVCNYESYGALKANGYGNNYTFVDTNVTLLDECSDRQPLFEFNYQYLPRGYAITLNNATGSYISRNLFFGDTNVRQINSVNSSDTEFWLNSLISGAFDNYDGVSACYGSEGNFYVENYTGNIPSDECGLVDITYYYDFGDGNVLIDWKKQSSVYDISYYVYGNDSLQLITDETITRFTPSVNYSYIKVRPYDNDNGVFGIADLYNATYPNATSTPTPTTPTTTPTGGGISGETSSRGISGRIYSPGKPQYKNFTFWIESENKTKTSIDAYPSYQYAGVLLIKNLGNIGINVSITCSYEDVGNNPCKFTDIKNTNLYALPNGIAYTPIKINVPKEIELCSYHYKLVATADNKSLKNEIEIFLNIKEKTTGTVEGAKEESGILLWLVIFIIVFIPPISYIIYHYQKKKWRRKR